MGKTMIILGLTLLAALGTAGTDLAASPVARVNGAWIVVEDIIPSCPPEARDVEVARAPLPGRTSFVSGAEVRRALEAAGLDASSFRIPKSWRVVRPSRRPAPDELRDQVGAAIAAVLPQGMKVDSLSALPSFEVPVGPYETTARWVQPPLGSDRVSIPIELSSDGEVFAKWQASVKLKHETLLPVLVRPLPAGAVLDQSNVQLLAVPTPRSLAQMATTEPQVLGRRLRRDAPAGEPLPLTDLESVVVVRRGDAVVLESLHGSIRITASAVAREDGGQGERIRVATGSTQKLLWARIIGPGKAVVTP